MSKQWKYTVSKNGRHQISELGGGNVCMIWNCKNKESNAHLIAAAQEMYEMLSKIHEYLEVSGPTGFNLSLDINDLLKKARGEK